MVEVKHGRGQKLILRNKNRLITYTKCQQIVSLLCLFPYISWYIHLSHCITTYNNRIKYVELQNFVQYFVHFSIFTAQNNFSFLCVSRAIFMGRGDREQQSYRVCSFFSYINCKSIYLSYLESTKDQVFHEGADDLKKVNWEIICRSCLEQIN